MNIVMPMAGRGERFSKEGYRMPKPLIQVDGIPMFVKATQSLPLALAKQIIFVILQEHDTKFGFSSVIRKYFSAYPIKIVCLPQVTRGQALTVVAALNASSAKHESLLIFNADSAFEDNLESFFSSIDPTVRGMLQVFTDDQPRWSFVRTDDDGLVLETAEKRVISSNASTGLYWFREGTTFLSLVRRSTNKAGERFIAPLYNNLIQEGARVIAKPVKRFFCYGTPSDFEEATKHGKYYVYAGPIRG